MRLGKALAALSVVGAVLVPVPAAEATAQPCSRGLVALTFDDGPVGTVTKRLVRSLTDLHVPATFFMLGSRVHADPTAARLVARHGFVIGNHTWSHHQLTTMSDTAIRAELASTRRELVSRGIAPSRLMRPPYGSTNARVNRVVSGLGFVPVLWTIDTRDWAGGSARSIATYVLKHLRAHSRNIVLQHDGVRRSPTSVAAVPRIVTGARARGYCFASLDNAGRPAPPVPTLRVRVSAGHEAQRVPARLQLTLDRPTSRRVSLRLSTGSGTATPHADFSPVARTIVFPVGSTHASVAIPVVDDRVYERVESFAVRLTRASGLRLTAGTLGVPIVSNDPAPRPPPPPPSPPTGTAPRHAPTAAPDNTTP